MVATQYCADCFLLLSYAYIALEIRLRFILVPLEGLLTAKINSFIIFFRLILYTDNDGTEISIRRKIL